MKQQEEHFATNLLIWQEVIKKTEYKNNILQKLKLSKVKMGRAPPFSQKKKKKEKLQSCTKCSSKLIRDALNLHESSSTAPSFIRFLQVREISLIIGQT